MRGIATRGRAARSPTVTHDSTLVLSLGAVLDERLTVAPCAASAQLRVELLEDARGDLADRLVTERGTDMIPQVALVARARALLDVVDPQPVLERRAACRPRPGMALFVDLSAEPVQDPLCLTLVGGRLTQVQPLPRSAGPYRRRPSRAMSCPAARSCLEPGTYRPSASPCRDGNGHSHPSWVPRQWMSEGSLT